MIQPGELGVTGREKGRHSRIQLAERNEISYSISHFLVPAQRDKNKIDFFMFTRIKVSRLVRDLRRC